jgi:threonine aldolase
MEKAMGMVDLRSDTVTKPTPKMREAMANAPVGDDVYGEDPTVNRLEAESAAMLGKESALFVPSGTMGNLVAILMNCGRGDEIILGDRSHTFLYEAGGVSALGGVHVHTVPNQPDGTIRLKDLHAAIRPDDIHAPVTRLITLENTHNRCEGNYLTLKYTQAVSRLAREHDLLVHMDGARIFNAAVAQGVNPAELVAPLDSVTFCLSKGLCAPVGSVLCGSTASIGRARRIRKQLGGGMRQAGVIAAAGLVAINEMADRLVEDHRRAQELAERLLAIDGLKVETEIPKTNMVYLSLDERLGLSAESVKKRLFQQGVLVGVVGPHRFRLVTHYWIRDPDVDRAVGAFQRVIS